MKGRTTLIIEKETWRKSYKFEAYKNSRKSTGNSKLSITETKAGASHGESNTTNNKAAISIEDAEGRQNSSKKTQIGSGKKRLSMRRRRSNVNLLSRYLNLTRRRP